MKERPAVTEPPLSPTRTVAVVRRVGRRFWLTIGIAATLEVPGRQSGWPRRVTVIPVQFDGNLYVMAWGGVTHWVRNLRAARQAQLRRRRRTEAVSAVEVEGDERDGVIAAYLRKMGPLKSDFNRRPSAENHPVFRLEPISPQGEQTLG